MAYGRHLSGIKLGKGRDGRSLRVRRCRSGVKRHRVRDEARSGWAEQDSGMRWSTLMRGSKDALKKGGVAPEDIVEDEGYRPPLPRRYRVARSQERGTPRRLRPNSGAGNAGA